MLKKNLHIISLLLLLFFQAITFGQELSTLTIVVSDVQIDPNGDILVIGENGEVVELPGGEDIVITDSNGQVWAVDEEGNVTPQGTQAEGGASNPENTNGVNNNGQATVISAKGVVVTFKKDSNSKYGFDSYESSYSATKDLYKKLGNNYYIPYKAVAKNDTETIVANLAITDSKIKPQDIVFKTKDGVAITKIDSTATSYTLQLKGVFDDAEIETQALVKQGTKYEVAGAFIQYQATPKNVKVVVVNTSNTTIRIIKESLQNIYQQAMVNLTITEINDFKNDLETLAPNETIQSGESGFVAQYTEQQRQINNKLKQHSQYQQDAYYLIVTDKTPSSASEKGLMPLGRQFGYVYTTNCSTADCVALTAAHELGHGAFQLKHPFSSQGYQYPQNATNWLLDYKDGTKLPFVHWQAIHNPKLRIGVFDKDGEGEHNKNAHLALTSSGKIIDNFYLDGKKIGVSVLITTNNYTIETIKYNNLKYSWNSQKESFINGSEEITVKEVAKTIDKVNLFRSRGDGCTYDYVLINWSSDDEKATNINERIQEKIKNFKETDWKLSPLNIRDDSCNNVFIKELLAKDQQDCSYTEIQNGVAELKKALQLTDAQKVTTTVNNTCLSAIRNLDYTEIESLINTITTKLPKIKEQSEVAILRLMNAIKSDAYTSFYSYLEKEDNKILKLLIDEMDDASIYFFTDKKNYTNFIGALVTMFNQNTKSIANRWPEKTEDYATRTVNLNPIDYSSDTSSVFSLKFTSKHNKGEYNENTGNITINDVYTTYFYNAFDTNGNGVTKVEHTEKVTEISPLTPIIMVPKGDKLPLVTTALDNNTLGNNYYIVPAIFLKYNSDKIRNNYIEKGIVTTLDVATIALSGGTALATKVHWVRRAWALAEVAGAVGNIAVNTSTVDPNSNLGKAINVYNLGMGIIGVKNLTVGGYKFVNKLPQATKTLLKENKGLRDLLITKYTEWKTLTTNLDNLSDAERKLVNEQEQVWKALGVFDKLVDVIYTNIKYKDFIKTFKTTEEQYKKAYQLWGKEKWNELYEFFVKNNINKFDGIVWPPMSGFAKIIEKVKGSSYRKNIDRFQKSTQPSLGGGFGSPIRRNIEGVDDLVYTYDSRMLGDKLKEGSYYFEFKMSEKATDVELTIGDVAPWFNKQANLAGEQIEFSKKLHELDISYFEPGSIKAKVLVLGKWRKCVIKGKSVVTELQNVFNRLPLDVSDDIVDYINKSEDVFNIFIKAKDSGKLDELIEAYKIFRKNGNKTPCL